VLRRDNPGSFIVARYPLEERIFSFFSSPSDWRRRVSTPS
jgi:hypothetical protein